MWHIIKYFRTIDNQRAKEKRLKRLSTADEQCVSFAQYFSRSVSKLNMNLSMVPKLTAIKLNCKIILFDFEILTRSPIPRANLSG